MAKMPRDKDEQKENHSDQPDLPEVGSEQAQPVSEQVTYRPGPEDPAQVTWRGLKFEANRPKTVSDASLIAAARGNKHFHVGAFDQGADAAPVDATPKTAEEYRAHVVAWLKRAQSVDELMDNWHKDARLRAVCEAGHDDYAYLGTLIEPKLNELARAEEISRTQVAERWAAHGVNELPW